MVDSNILLIKLEQRLALDYIKYIMDQRLNLVYIQRKLKLIEEEALRLSQSLDQKLQRIEILLSKIEKQIFG